MPCPHFYEKLCFSKFQFHPIKVYTAEYSPDNIYLSKDNKRNTRRWCEICLKLTIKTSKRRHWQRPCVFSVNFEHISNFFLMFYCWLWTSKYLLEGLIYKFIYKCVQCMKFVNHPFSFDCSLFFTFSFSFSLQSFLRIFSSEFLLISRLKT